MRAVAAGLCLWLLAGSPAAADLSQDEIRELENHLVLLGFDPGPVDGVADAATSRAIEAYQSFAALRVDGVASRALLEELRGVTQSLGKIEDKAVEEVPPAAAVGTAAPDDESAGTGQPGEVVASPPAARATGETWDTAIHLASFKQESKAHEEWQRLQRRLPDLLGDMTPSVREVDLGDKGLFYRLYAGPFPNLATAQDFCLTVNLEGFDCAVARGAALRIASTSPAVTPGAGGAGAAQPEAKAETAAAEERPPPEPDIAAPDEGGEAVPPAAGLEAPAPPAVGEVNAAAAPANAPKPSTAGEEAVAAAPVAAPETTATEEAAAIEPTEEGVADSPLPAIPPAASVAELVPHAAVGAPTILIPAAQLGEASLGGYRRGTSETRQSGTTAGGPTVLITPTQFAAPAGESIEPETASPVAATTVPRAPTATEAGPPVEAAGKDTQTAMLVLSGAQDYATANEAFQNSDCASAIVHYTRAFETGGLPQRALADGYNNRGRCFYDQARYHEALADFDKAIELDRAFAAAYYNRGRAHNATGDVAQARADLDAAYGLGFGRLESEP